MQAFSPSVRIRITALAAVVVSTGMVPASAADWRPFANARFGFAVDVPAAYRVGPPPANGDGRQFTSPDGVVVVRAYGAYLSAPGAYAADAEQTIQSERGDGLAVTYSAIGRDRYTISGTLGDRIVYLHAVPTCGRDGVATVRIDYPARVRSRLDAIVARVAASLRGSGRC